MKLLFAPDAFKDSVSARTVSGIVRRKAEEIFTHCEMEEIPLADGDKGTVEVLTAALNGKIEQTTVRNYEGAPIQVTYGILDDNTAVLEAGQVLQDGGSLESSMRHKLLFSSSAGVGELIRHVLESGYRRIIIGAGTGVVNDGGMGCAHALGVAFYNQKGERLHPSGIALKDIDRIDVSGLDERLREAEVTVLCPVRNELFGDEGATYVYGAMNGGGPEELILLEKGMRHYAHKLTQATGVQVGGLAGAGAGGGLPAALKAFCNAELKNGISTVLKMICFEQRVERANLVVVGEGVLDGTSVYGKAISGIGMMCKAKQIPVVALVGRLDKDANRLYHYGISAVMSSVGSIMTQEEATQNAEALIEEAAERMFRLLAVGMQMQHGEPFIPEAGIDLRYKREKKGQIKWAVSPDWDM